MIGCNENKNDGKANTHDQGYLYYIMQVIITIRLL